MSEKPKIIYIAEPHGFCAGVRRALNIAEEALNVFGAPIYCLKEIVHNQMVVEDLMGRGIVFVAKLEDIPVGATALFSAHGVSPVIKGRAAELRLNIIDATCPFVSKVHSEVRKYARSGFSILLLGDADHDEIVGVAGEAPDSVIIISNEEEARQVTVPTPDKVAIMTQTTLSVEDTEKTFSVLASRFPKLKKAPGSCICYATTNRQRAVVELAKRCGLILVLGSKNSSNSRRLVDVAESAGCPAKLIDTQRSLRGIDIGRVSEIGITAGASTPERFVDHALLFLQGSGFESVEVIKVAEEKIDLKLPEILRKHRG